MTVESGPGKQLTPVSAKKNRPSGGNSNVGTPNSALKISDFLKNKGNSNSCVSPKPSTSSGLCGNSLANNRSQNMRNISTILSGKKCL